MRILFLGDLYAEAGIAAVEKFLPIIKRDYDYDLLFVNGENVTQGLGLNLKDYKKLMSLGVAGISLGNHAFSKKELLEFIDEANIVRPLNYPKNTPGKPVLTINFNGIKIALIQLMGRVFMHDPLNNPFEAIDEVLENLDSDYVVVDVHAETTSEKLALAHYLDGRVDAVLGTHTHVATNDAMKLPKGTLYLTDLGMCGAKFGILGADKKLVLNKFLTGMPTRLKPEQTNILQLNGALLDFEQKTIETINYSDKE